MSPTPARRPGDRGEISRFHSPGFPGAQHHTPKPATSHNAPTLAHIYPRGMAQSLCYPTKCNKCGKTTWAGCGQHVASVKAQVPAGQWCTGEREPRKKFRLFG